MIFLISTLFIRPDQKKGGGVSILIQSNITALLIPHLTAVNKVFESLAVELVNNNYKFHIVGIYIPPSTSLVDFNTLFFNLFTDNDRNKFMAIIGDFNIDNLALSFSNQVNQFLDELLKNLYFCPSSTLPRASRRQAQPALIIFI